MLLINNDDDDDDDDDDYNDDDEEDDDGDGDENNDYDWFSCFEWLKVQLMINCIGWQTDKLDGFLHIFLHVLLQLTLVLANPEGTEQFSLL